MEEKWKDVVGYEDTYIVSNTGRVMRKQYISVNKSGVKTFQQQRELKQLINFRGYPKVTLVKNKKTKVVFVHRLVAEAFIPNPQNYPQVNHKDEVKTNNNVDNLEWCDNKYNCNYGCKTQIDRINHAKKIYQIKDGVIIKVYLGLYELDKSEFNRYGVLRCCEGKIDEFMGYQWKRDKNVIISENEKEDARQLWALKTKKREL